MESTLVVYLFAFVLLGSPTGAKPADWPARSVATTPVGRWKTVDEATGKISSGVVIWELDGTLYGQIVWTVEF
jgi:hypothetical protein